MSGDGLLSGSAAGESTRSSRETMRFGHLTGKTLMMTTVLNVV